MAMAIAVLSLIVVGVRHQQESTGRQRGLHALQTLVPETPPSTPPLPSTSTTLPGEAWTGPVEHIFFHPLVRRPDLAFARTRLGKGYRDYFVTVTEFARILDQLYRNQWILVDMHQAVNGQLVVPTGKKPLVISVDDLNFYQYMRDNGGSWRLVLDGGRVRVEVHDPDTGVGSVTDEEIVPMLDLFVRAHPDFSLNGAKGVIALTGYQGVLGERVDTDDIAADEAAKARAAAVAATMKVTGWLFASHSYGHITVTKRSEAQIRIDANKWKNTVEPIVGPTDIFIFPYGAAPGLNSGRVRMLHEEFGFAIFCDIGGHPAMETRAGLTRFPRRHIDGIAFAQQADDLQPLFDVSTVIDIASRTADR
jgi:hypothetical protein